VGEGKEKVLGSSWEVIKGKTQCPSIPQIIESDKKEFLKYSILLKLNK
jgi:hypothetical protein